ncbi:MAG: DUF1292 domain-containing protein [Clostridiales bacterium]|nr:DUF1292 domain-containing protein [Clostridiales bacterium]
MDEKKKNQQGCDCGCDHEHHHHDADCDCGCAVDEDVVMLEDEDGNEIAFYHIATLERDGKEYACLQQAEDEDPIVEIFELEEVEEDGELFYNFLPIDDELYEALYKQLEEEVAAMGEEDCDDPDCECHHHHED